MGTGYTRNDTGNNIADGNVINASDLDGEFDAVVSAFNASTGHTHDGTAAEGAPVTVVGPAQDFVVSATEIKPKTTNTLDIGTSALQFKNLYVDGTGYIDAVDIDGGNIDGTTIGASSAAAITGTTITGTSFVTSGDMTFGDDDKAIFGAGSDLQIYHDGSNSYVRDVGTGNLNISGEEVRILNSGNSELKALFTTDGSVELYYDNSKTFETASGGIDVTGRIGVNTTAAYTLDVTQAQADIAKFKRSSAGATEVLIDTSGSGDAQLVFADNGTDSWAIGRDNTNGDFVIAASGALGTSNAINIESGGNVGIGTDSPAFSTGSGLEIERAGTSTIRLQNTSTSKSAELNMATDFEFVTINSASDFVFKPAAGSEKLRVDTTGVGIGLTPSYALHVKGDAAIQQGTIALRVGADSGGTTVTNSTQKIARIATPHYTNAEEPMAIVMGIADSSENKVDVGGNSSLMNTATRIAFFTAANTTTVSGSERMRITSGGDVLIGTTSTSIAGQSSNSGVRIGDGFIQAARASDMQMILNRLTSDGDIAIFQKDGTEVGAIQSSSGGLIITSGSGGTAALTINSSQAATFSGPIGVNGATPNSSIPITVPNQDYIAWYDSGTSGGTAAYIRGDGGALKLGGSSYSFDNAVATTFAGNIVANAATPQVIWQVSGTEKGYARVSSSTLQINATDNMSLRTGGTDAVHIDGNQNIIINGTGIANSAKLQVETDTDTSADGAGVLYIRQKSTTAGASASILFASHEGAGENRRAYIEGLKTGAGNGGGLAFSTRQAGGTFNDQALLIDDLGNVGIGETSPSLGSGSSGLHITSSQHARIKLESGADDESGIQFTEAGTDQWRIAYDAASNHLEFTESGVADRMVIQDGGNVGIGSTAPDNKLFVAATATGGYVANTDTTWNGITIRQTLSHASSAAGLKFETTSTTQNGVAAIVAERVTTNKANLNFLVSDDNGTTYTEALILDGTGIAIFNETIRANSIGGAPIEIQNGSEVTFGRITHDSTGTGHIKMRGDSGKGLKLGSNGSDVMTIDTSGNTTLTGNLTVNGTISGGTFPDFLSTAYTFDGLYITGNGSSKITTWGYGAIAEEDHDSNNYGWHDGGGSDFPAYWAVYMDGESYAVNRLTLSIHANSIGNFKLQGSNNANTSGTFYNTGTWTDLTFDSTGSSFTSQNGGGTSSGYPETTEFTYRYDNNTAYTHYRVQVDDTSQPGSSGGTSGYAAYYIKLDRI